MKVFLIIQFRINADSGLTLKTEFFAVYLT